MKELFIVEKVNDRITRIKMPYVCAYLVEGDDRAMLIDNGWGYGDIKSVVDSLTDLPYEVMLTHGHGDHGGANSQFDRIYLNPLDYQLEKYSCSDQVRTKLLSRFLKLKRQEFHPNLLLPYQETEFLPLEEGMTFDLGGISLMPVLVSGHSMGSMTIIIPEERIAIFGDSCHNGVLINLASSATVATYLESLNHLKTFEKLYDRVLINHVDYEEPKEVLDATILWAKRILNQTDDHVEVNKHGDHYFIARDRARSYSPFERLGNIKYATIK